LKLDRFEMIELLRDYKYRSAVDKVISHFGLEPDDWKSVPVHRDISSAMHNPGTWEVIYPYGINLLQPGHYWGWHSVYGWENWISTSVAYQITIRLPQYSEI